MHVLPTVYWCLNHHCLHCFLNYSKLKIPKMDCICVHFKSEWMDLFGFCQHVNLPILINTCTYNLIIIHKLCTKPARECTVIYEKYLDIIVKKLLCELTDSHKPLPLCNLSTWKIDLSLSFHLYFISLFRQMNSWIKRTKSNVVSP